MIRMPEFMASMLLAEALRFTCRPPDQVIPNQHGQDYLHRWHLTPRGDGPATYLHLFLASDDDRALHDHPWPSIGIILAGEYLEHVADHRDAHKGTTFGQPANVLHRRAGDVIPRAPEHTHRVELLNDDQGRPRPVWTLFMVGPRCREWGFHCADWTHWRAFEATGGCA